MPRSAIDATRFTSTTPHASAPGATIPLKSSLKMQPSPMGETPKEKVRRLRAAADRAREAKASTFDKVIIRGRVWADRAHRITMLGLITASFICGGLTIYALTDMAIHNRRKRAEFYAEQKAMHASGVQFARQAIEAGTATDQQIKLINMEDKKAALEAAKQSKKGVFTKAKEVLFWGLKKEEGENAETSEKGLGYERINEGDNGLGERESDIIRAVEDKKMHVSTKAKQVFEKEKERQRTGGPLDQLGTESAKTGSPEKQPKSAGWFSYVTGR